MDNNIKYTGAAGDNSDPALLARGTEGAYDPRNHRIRPQEAFKSPHNVTVGGGILIDGIPYSREHLTRGSGSYSTQAEVFQKSYAELYAKWLVMEPERKRLQQELDAANARCLKLEGVLEYLEKQAKLREKNHG